MTYPRYTWNCGNFYERSLTLSCPLAAELILLADEPLKFEEVQIQKSELKGIKIFSTDVLHSILKKLIPIQETAISILQERNLTIDRRLLMVGLYCDKLEEIFTNNQIDELEKVNAIYQNSNFLQEQANQFSAVIKFNASGYIRIMLEFLNTLYGQAGGNKQGQGDRLILDAITNTLNLPSNSNEPFKISEVAKTYNSLNAKREKFVSHFSTIFENYLVNEFFMNLYPFRFNGSRTFNFSVFISIYKMLELLAFSMETNMNSNKEDLISEIIWYANNIDHNLSYVNKISDCMRKNCDIVEIMQNMLQV